MDVFDLFARIGIDTSEFDAGLNAASNSASSFGGKMKSAFETAGKVAKVAMGAASAAGAAFTVSAVKTGAEFDESMSQIAATMGLSVADIEANVNGAGDTFDALRAKALEMGSATKFTATESAEGLNILAMSGYDATESIEMIEDVLHLAAAGAIDMGNAAGYISGAMKGFADETKDSEYYADLMAKGATLANTNVSQLGEALSGSAAAAKSYGQSADTVTLALLRLAEQGETGSAASTALAAAMKNLYAPTDQASKLLQQLGVQAFDPVTGAARDFNDVVNELDVALAGYSDEQKTAYAQTIFGIQGFDAYNKMVVTSVETQEEWAEALANSSGEAAQQYDTMTDNLTGDLAILNSALDGVKIAISDKLKPALREGVQFFTRLAETAQKFIEEGGIEEIIQKFKELSPVISGATAALVAYKTATAISGVISALTKATEGQTIAQMALNAVMNANPFAIVVSLIAAVGAALVTLYMTNEEFREKITTAWSSVKEKIGNAVAAIETFFMETIPKAGQKAVAWFQELPEKMKEIGSNIVSGIWEGIKASAKWFSDQVKGFFSGIVDNVKGFLGIHSPSKLFREEIGQYIGLGVAAGIGDTEDEATKAAEDMAKEVYSVSKEWADRQTKYMELSYGEQAELWETIQGQFVEGSKQYLDAEEKIFDLRKKQSEEQEKLLEEQAQARENFAQKVEDINKNIANIEAEYQNQLTSRAQEIFNAYSLFDAVPERQEKSGQELIDNLAGQIAAVEEFYSGLDELASRGVGEDLVEELRSMGPSAIDELSALLSLSDEKLTEYADLFAEKQALANDIATEELSGLRDETDAKILEQIQSASSLYEEYAPDVGMTFTDMLASGIEAGTDSVVSASVAAAQSAMDAFNQVLADYGYSGMSLENLSSSNIASRIANSTSTTEAPVGADVVMPITMEIDGEVLARKTYRYNQNEAARIGHSMVQL